MRRAVALHLTILLVAVTCLYGGTRKVPEGIEFTYHDPSAYSVSLAGSFNSWDTRSNPMVKDDEGTWSTVIPLEAGKYEYKFVVNGSDWMADPDNPRVVGDYGNSEIEIDSEGNPVAGGGVVELISNTAANARVMINGWFRGIYTTRKDGLGDTRWRLSRPGHEMYVSFNPTIGSDVKGSVTMRIDSGQGDIREVTADLYAGHLAFKSSYFDVTAYHNEEILSLDDPLEALGHEDLPGTPWKDNLDFGRGTQGAILDLRLKGIGLQTLYSNTYDDDIYNSEARWQAISADSLASRTRYDNTGTDILAVRAKRELLGVKWGGTLVSRRSGWWVGFEENNVVDPAIEAYRKESDDDESTWFEVGTSELFIGGDIAIDPAAWLTVFGEYAKTAYEAAWDAGNRVRIQGDQKVDGSIDAPIGDEQGSRLKGGLEMSGGDHRLRCSFERAHSGGMNENEAYITNLALPFEDPDNRLIDLYGLKAIEAASYDRVYEKVNGIDEFVIYEEEPLPERDSDITELDVGTKLMGMDLGLYLDIAKTTWDYPDTAEKDFENKRVLVMPSLGGGLLGERLSYNLLYAISRDNLSARRPNLFDKNEFEARGDFKLTDEWGVYYNLRWVGYKWTEDEAGKSKSFFDPHVALVWSPVPRVELRLGYGLNPLYYTDTPVQGREIGRERWLSSYLWPRPGSTLIDAEAALEDLKIITLMGVIAF
jgi:hypothetical protein